MLRDRSPLSVGSVVVAFEAVCPTRLDLLHKQYRRLCRILVEVEEWGQVNLLNLLARYARTMLPRPFVRDGEEELDSDVELLLTSVEPLFQSRNPAVRAGPHTTWYLLTQFAMTLTGGTGCNKSTLLRWYTLPATQDSIPTIAPAFDIARG